MFWKNFVLLCNEKNIAPNTACASLGYSSAIATKWKNGSIPRSTTLQKIADYFDVTVEYLLRDEDEKKEALEKTASAMDGLTEDERKDVLDYIEFVKSKRKDD